MKTFTTFTLVLATAASLAAQQANPQPNTSAPKPPAGVNVPAGVTPPADYVIGPDDLLAIVFWRDKDLSSEVAVRPDGKISLPLLNDVEAAGLTPEQLRVKLTEAGSKSESTSQSQAPNSK